MRRFRYRLGRVLALRQQESDAARLTLARAVGALARCDEQIAVIDRLAAECQHGSAPGATTEALAGGLLRGLEVARLRAQRSRRAADQQVAVARAHFVQRRAAAAALAKLRDVRRAEWRAAAATAERDELEELARLARHADARARDAMGELP